MTVMELLVHPHACEEAKEFLNNDFLNDFIFSLYKKKWDNFVKKIYYTYLMWMLLYVLLITCIASPSIMLDGFWQARPKGPEVKPTLSSTLRKAQPRVGKLGP